MDGQGGDFYPVEPAQLLPLLPAPPENWKLTFSIAKERLSYALLPETLAVRKYHFVPPLPPPGNPPSPPSPPKDITLTLIDTGGDPERIRTFENFKPSPDPKGPNILVQGFEAVKVTNDPSTFLTIKISDRFLLSARFDNMSDREVDAWVQLALPAQKMADASSASPNVPLQSGFITLSYIDELKPATNFQSKASFQDKADMKKALMHLQSHPTAAPSGP